MTRYLVLLCGINVGGRNKVPMAALRELLESHGHTRVSTYIASGNVILSSDQSAAGRRRWRCWSAWRRPRTMAEGYSSGMRRPIDTSLEARERQLAIYRAMAPETRLRLAAELSADVRSLTEAGSRGRATRTPSRRASGDR